jgi:hypothetical protein
MKEALESLERIVYTLFFFYSIVIL